MSTQSAIEWTDATWNPVRGCVKVSPGCAHCYAETFAERFRGVKGHAYEQGFDLRLVPEKLAEPLRWKKPRRVFVNSMSDLFQDGVPDDYIDQVFAVMALAPQHTFQILTKRADRMRAYMGTSDRWGAVARWLRAYADPQRRSRPTPDDQGSPSTEAAGQRFRLRWPLPHVWLGVSVENQHWKGRIDDLRATPAAIRFLSIEPLLEDIGVLNLRGIHWVIVGGESGPGARACDVAWVRSIIAQCRRGACVPVFVKQLGSNPAPLVVQCGAVLERLWLAHRKGGDPADWPADLRVRDFPVRADGRITGQVDA